MNTSKGMIIQRQRQRKNNENENINVGSIHDPSIVDGGGDGGVCLSRNGSSTTTTPSSSAPSSPAHSIEGMMIQSRRQTLHDKKKGRNGSNVWGALGDVRFVIAIGCFICLLVAITTTTSITTSDRRQNYDNIDLMAVARLKKNHRKNPIHERVKDLNELNKKRNAESILRRKQPDSGAGSIDGTVPIQVDDDDDDVGTGNTADYDGTANNKKYDKSMVEGTITTMKKTNDGPPSDLVLHGKRSKYTPCPIKYRKHAFVALMDSFNVRRAFQSQGWFVTSNPSDRYSQELHIVYQKGRINNATFAGFQPYQRYSRLTQFVKYVDSKDGFVAGLRRYQQKHEQNNRKRSKNKKTNSDSTAITTSTAIRTNKNLIYFLPETYRLGLESDRQAFQKALDAENAVGIYRPWVLKQTRASRGRGVEMLAPASDALYGAMQRTIDDKTSNYIVQQYVCNELTWFEGQKFDLRFYWMVASIDPLIVLYHDGFVRVADGVYDETNFNDSKSHLTNTAVNKGGPGKQVTATSSSVGVSSSGSNTVFENKEEDVLADALWRRIRQHYEQNKEHLSNRISDSLGGNVSPSDIDPARHVRNQLKEAISTTAAAFKHVLTADVANTTKINAENRFAIYGCDFIIDADLDVYYVEAQDGPQMKDTHDFRIDLYRKMLRPMVNTVEEIAIKQETNAKGNILPLQNLEEWEIVYAGNQWRYRYRDYKRNTKDKKGCSLSSSQS